jgi:hypothetical protein
VTALKSVDLPTFGRPTIPALSMGREAREKTDNCNAYVLKN